MRFAAISSVMYACLLSGSLGAAGYARAAGDADAVVNDLKSKGYRVVVTRQGNRPQSDCAVLSVNLQSPVIAQQVPRIARGQYVTPQANSYKVANVTLQC